MSFLWLNYKVLDFKCVIYCGKHIWWNVVSLCSPRRDEAHHKRKKVELLLPERGERSNSRMKLMMVGQKWSMSGQWDPFYIYDIVHHTIMFGHESHVLYRSPYAILSSLGMRCHFLYWVHDSILQKKKIHLRQFWECVYVCVCAYFMLKCYITRLKFHLWSE